MEKRIIYSKKYPNHYLKIKEEMAELESEYNKEEEDKEIKEAAERFKQRLNAKSVFVLMPERVNTSKLFIEKLIAFSKFYEYDLEIEERKAYISASLLVYYADFSKESRDILLMADKITVFPAKDGKVGLNLTLYTHKQFLPSGEEII